MPCPFANAAALTLLRVCGHEHLRERHVAHWELEGSDGQPSVRAAHVDALVEG